MNRFFIKTTLGFLSMLVFHKSQCQDVQFSQYQFTPTLVNPALVGTFQTPQLMLGYRSQWRSIDGQYATPVFTGILPFSNKAGVRKGGIGLTALSDKAGQVVYVQNTGVHLSAAYNVSLGKELAMAWGVNAGFNQRSLSMDGALTESQYGGASGLHTGLANGEEDGRLSKGYFDIGTGVLLYADNVLQRRRYYVGVSAYHLTKPRTELGTTKETLPIRLTAMAGVLVFQNNNFTVTPEVLYTRMAGNQRVMAGARFRYYFTNPENKFTKEASIAFVPRYSLNEALVLAMEFHKKFFTLGFGYDYTLYGLNTFNKGRGATEVFVAVALPSRKKKQPQDPVTSEYSVGQAREFIVQKAEEPDNTKGYVLHLQEVVRFEFNDTTLSRSAKSTINDVASLMKGNKYLKVRVIGHSDNLGTQKRNQQISEERAQRVVDYLVLCGIPRNRVKLVGRGDSEPVQGNNTEEGRAKNRRVEFELFK